MRSGFVAGFGLVAVVAAASASADVTVADMGGSFAEQPFFYGFYYGDTPRNAISFSANPGDDTNTAAVITQGNLQVASLGAPFYDPARPTSYFTDRGGSIGPDLLASFASYSSAAVIPFSASPSIIGFRFDNGYGYQYGYAEIAGTELIGFRFETTANTGVDIFPILSGGGGIGATVPEPAAWALMIGGFAMTGVAARRRRTAVAA